MQEPTENTVINIKKLGVLFNGVGVLQKVNFTINKGENVVVLGKSGSGKSTLIKCIIGLIRPQEGEIFVFGKELTGMRYEELNAVRMKIGFLFQNAALYDSMTVRENLFFPLRYHKREFTDKKAEALILEMLDNVGLKEAIDKMPAELSGGMSKRVGLARALILEPAIILYDEPTTGLDTVTAKEISQLILDIQRKNKTSSIIITHDMTCAKMTADRILMLKDGMITAEGTYEELEKSDDIWIKSFFT